MPLFQNNPTIGQIPLPNPPKASSKRLLQDMSYLIPPVLPFANSKAAKATGVDVKPSLPKPLSTHNTPKPSSQPVLLPKPSPALTTMPAAVQPMFATDVENDEENKPAGAKLTSLASGSSKQSTPKQGVTRSLIQSAVYPSQPAHQSSYPQIPPFKRPTPKMSAQTPFQSKPPGKRAQSFPQASETNRPFSAPVMSNYPPMNNMNNMNNMNTMNGMNGMYDYNGMMPMMSSVPPMNGMVNPAFSQSQMMAPRPMPMMSNYPPMSNRPNTPRMSGMPGMPMDGQAMAMNYPYSGAMYGGAPFYQPVQPMMSDGKVGAANMGKVPMQMPTMMERSVPQSQPGMMQPGMMQPFYMSGMPAEMEGDMLPGNQ